MGFGREASGNPPRSSGYASYLRSGVSATVPRPHMSRCSLYGCDLGSLPLSSSGFVLRHGAPAYPESGRLGFFAARPDSTFILSWVHGAWSCLCTGLWRARLPLCKQGPPGGHSRLSKRSWVLSKLVLPHLFSYSSYRCRSDLRVLDAPAPALIDRPVATPVQARRTSIGKR